jgi:hypothetical protein
MNFTKKQRYFSGYLKSINRKVLYSEPIFLIDVDFYEYSKDQTGAAENAERYTISLPVQLTKSKKLLFNVSRFAEIDEDLGVLLRYITIGKTPITTPTSIKDRIMKTYSILFETYNIKKYELIDFSKDLFVEVDKLMAKRSINIAILDFDVTNNADAVCAAALKQIFFKYTEGDAAFVSKKAIIKYMELNKYTVSVDCRIVYNDYIIAPFCLMFTRNP